MIVVVKQQHGEECKLERDEREESEKRNSFDFLEAMFSRQHCHIYTTIVLLLFIHSTKILLCIPT